MSFTCIDRIILRLRLRVIIPVSMCPQRIIDRYLLRCFLGMFFHYNKVCNCTANFRQISAFGIFPNRICRNSVTAKGDGYLLYLAFKDPLVMYHSVQSPIRFYLGLFLFPLMDLLNMRILSCQPFYHCCGGDTVDKDGSQYNERNHRP